MSDLPYNICIQMENLKDRRAKIAAMLKPLIARQHDATVYPINASSNKFVWAIAGRGDPTQGDYNEKKFKTSLGFYAHYHEEWIKFFVTRTEYWYLERAYLHFYVLDKDNQEFSEYLLLHCDPNENREHAIYKQCPHLHIHAAEPPWPGAHIALNVSYLKEMLKDADSLMEAFESAIIMLKDQILQHI